MVGASRLALLIRNPLLRPAGLSRSLGNLLTLLWRERLGPRRPSFGCARVWLFDRLFAYRLLHDLVGQRIYIHALIIEHCRADRKTCGFQT